MSTSALLTLEQLGFAYDDRVILDGLNARILPGLTWVRGGDGRGKTTLLRLIAGELQPSSGCVHRLLAGAVFYADLRAPQLDDVIARAWLAQHAHTFAAWNADVSDALVHALRLSEHLDKSFHMMSAGMRRKVGLVAAVASQADVVMLETPFAALDSAACEVVSEVLAEAAAQRERAWLLADYTLPPSLSEAQLVGLIDLGD
jgi:ABC-type multidrug transport system ATPase subunit